MKTPDLKDNRTGCPTWVALLAIFLAIVCFPFGIAWLIYRQRRRICHQCNQFRVRGTMIGANFICRSCGNTHKPKGWLTRCLCPHEVTTSTPISYSGERLVTCSECGKSWIRKNQ
jgi:hypothetical protein